MDQVAVTLDRARNLVAEAGVAVEGVLDGLHREVRVATVNRLEESDLGISREIDVLSTIGYQLHQPPPCHCISYHKKKNFKIKNFYVMAKKLKICRRVFVLK